MTQKIDIHFPRAPLFGAGILIVATIVSVGLARMSPAPALTDLVKTEVAESRSLRFEDAADGSVHIYDAQTEETVAIAAPGTNGFLRGMMRGMMRTRKQYGASLTAPMLLERLSNGMVLLIDEEDKITLDLDAYGHTNADVFKAFLKSQSNLSNQGGQG
jgi:putative photosynthetic complex assembly protein